MGGGGGSTQQDRVPVMISTFARVTAPTFIVMMISREGWKEDPQTTPKGGKTEAGVSTEVVRTEVQASWCVSVAWT